MKDISFLVGGQKLVGKLFVSENLQSGNPAALFIHGWQSRQDRGFELAEALTQRGFICMTFDLRGHGKSEGDIRKFSRRDFLNDALAAYDFLVQIPGVDPKNITISGSSFGSYLAAILSSKRKVKSLILRVPSNYKDEGFEEPQYGARLTTEHMEWKKEIRNHVDTMALRATHDFQGKILLVESENDELVPTTVIQSYAEAVDDKKSLAHVIMSGAPHSLSQDAVRQKEYTNIVLKWLDLNPL